MPPSAPISLMDAVAALRAGDCLIYPTETLYALGCGATFAAGAARVHALKGRPADKPLPLLVGHVEQLPLVTGQASPELSRIAERFWPGPLAVLVPARAGLAPQVTDGKGFTAVRVTPHPTAAALSRLSGLPLIATSANRSGLPAAATPDGLDAALIAQTGLALLDPPWPGGGEPSTLVRVVGRFTLAVLRLGAVSLEALAAAGFSIAEQSEKF